MNHSILPRQHGLDEVLVTDKLDRRGARACELARENRAMTDLTRTLAERPSDLPAQLASSVLDCCQADSAGLTLLEPRPRPSTGEGREAFRWRAVAGRLGEHAGRTIARDEAPCSVVLQRDAVLLFEHPQRHFADLQRTEPAMVEVLSVPFYADDQPVGTLWAATHSDARQFDAEDARLLARLSEFASTEYRVVCELQEHERANARLRQAYADQQTLSSRLRHVATELTSSEHRTRRQLASELQEDLQQLLIAARLELAGGSSGDPLTRASAVLDQAVDVSRRLVCQLCPPALYETGLLPAVQWLADELARRQVLEVEVDCPQNEDDLPALDDDVRALLFEGVQELLGNVARHAGTHRAWVRIRANEAAVRVAIEDDGSGFDAAQALSDSLEGIGLFGVREWLVAIGGEMVLESGAERGTRVELHVPVTPRSEDESAPNG